MEKPGGAQPPAGLVAELRPELGLPCVGQSPEPSSVGRGQEQQAVFPEPQLPCLFCHLGVVWYGGEMYQTRAGLGRPLALALDHLRGLRHVAGLQTVMPVCRSTYLPGLSRGQSCPKA